MSTKWQDFAQKYAMHAKYGVIVPPDYQVSSFDFKTLLSANIRIRQITQVSALDDFINNFPSLKLQPPHNFNDLIIMHDFTNTIVNTFLSKKRGLNFPEEGTRLSKNLAEPLYISTKALNIHYGMQINMLYNWLPQNDNHLKEDESFSLKDVALRYYLTKEQYQETLFFGSAAVASFYLARMIKNCFEINKIINERPNNSDEILERLKNCLKYWEKIKEENLVVVEEFQADYFNQSLRPLVRGFKDIILEGVDNGQDLTVSAPGGSAGYDPTFQMFQAAFGIKSEGKYNEMQMMMRKGMANKHLECIQFLEENSHIREYCSMAGPKTRALFNKVILAYGSFLRVHSEFIAKFILGHSKQKQTDEKGHKGTAGTVIHEIILRYQSVEAQVIPEPLAPKAAAPKATSQKDAGFMEVLPKDAVLNDAVLNNFD